MDSDEKRDELTSSDVVTKYKSAAQIVNDALHFVLSKCKSKAKILDICKEGDSFIEGQTLSIYKKMERGVAFPTCISVNNTVGHFSPLASDKTVLEDGDMVKVDMGCHIDGFIALVGHTHVLQEGPVSGRKADVISAANTAAEVALRLVRPGKKNTDVTEAIQKVATAYDCKIVEGVLSHQMKQHVIDGNKVVLSVASPEATVEEVEFEENEVYAIDIVASTGDGKPKLIDEKQTTIYKKDETVNYQLKLKASRFIISEITKSFPHMPFTARSLEEKRARLGLVECVNHGHLQPYPVLYEKSGDFVAQIKFTVLLMPNGSDRITSHTFQELQPTKTIEDPEIKGWLALGIKKKKAKKAEEKKAETTDASSNSQEAERVIDSGLPPSTESQLVIRILLSSNTMTLGYVEKGIESYSLEARYSPGDPKELFLTQQDGFGAYDAERLSKLLEENKFAPHVISKILDPRICLPSLYQDEVSVGRIPPPPQFYLDEIDFIGKGGFGHVVLCRHSLDKRLYAVKKIRMERADVAVGEVHLLAIMKHPSIVRYYNSWYEKGFVRPPKNCQGFSSSDSSTPSPKVPDSEAYCLFIQMEYCKSNLRKYLKLSREIDGEFSWKAMKQIASGLDHIHIASVLHRDINPNNIFLDQHNDIKIGDFGLAKYTDETTSLFPSGSPSQPGTGIYRAPEIIDEHYKGIIDVKADMFSFGIICLELWCSFGTLTQRAECCSDLKNQRELPFGFAETFPVQADLILRLTSRNPWERPSAKEVFEEIANHV